jgi:hypothetical protein
MVRNSAFRECIVVLEVATTWKLRLQTIQRAIRAQDLAKLVFSFSCGKSDHQVNVVRSIQEGCSR